MPQIIRQLFEKQFAEKFGVREAIAVNSGTSALVGVLWSLDLLPSDEVITTPFTFVSTSNAVLIAGARPVFVDIGPHDHLLDVTRIEAAITAHTKVILPVHLFGRVCKMAAILDIAGRHKLIVVEDSAQAFGARCGERYAGTVGDAGCFSFYKTKNFSTFEGGMITVNTARLDAGKIRAIVDPIANKPDYRYLGFNFRMPEPCALIGYERLAFHMEGTLAELGKYDESDGYYPKLVYQTELYKQRGITGYCPVAEAVVEGIRKHG